MKTTPIDDIPVKPLPVRTQEAMKLGIPQRKAVATTTKPVSTGEGLMLSLIIALIVVGALVYVAELLPIDATFKRIIQVIAIVAAVIWVLKALWPAAGLG